MKNNSAFFFEIEKQFSWDELDARKKEIVRAGPLSTLPYLGLPGRFQAASCMLCYRFFISMGEEEDQ